MSSTAYPAGLPCPAVSVTTPAERRLSSDLPGNKQVRGLQRDYLADERIDFPPLTQAQADTFRAWHDETLHDGGAWFSAHWPSPQGGTLVRRFKGPLQWAYIHGGINKRMWRLSAQCEVRGRSVLPVASDVLLRLPFDAATGLRDVSPRRAAVSIYTAKPADWIVPEAASGISDVQYAVGDRSLYTGYAETNGASNSVFVYPSIPALTGDFTIQAWLYYDADSYPDTTVPIASNGIVQTEFDYELTGPGGLSIRLGGNISNSRFEWQTGEVTTLVPIVCGSTREWWHLGIVRKGGVISTYTAGEKQYSVIAPEPIGGVFPVSIGGFRRASPIGHGYWAPAYTDDVMISSIAEYDGDFTPPTMPLRYR
jgi:hypothetical protein